MTLILEIDYGRDTTFKAMCLAASSFLNGHQGQELLSFFDLFLVSDDGRLVCQQHPC